MMVKLIIKWSYLGNKEPIKSTQPNTGDTTNVCKFISLLDDSLLLIIFLPFKKRVVKNSDV